jgi:hypothetical protein
MRKLLIIAAALLALVSIAPAYARADHVCYEVLETSDNFLAMRWRPTTKAGILWALRQGETLIAGDPTTDTYVQDQLEKYPTKNWIYAHTRERRGSQAEGWVYRKYLKEISCYDSQPLMSTSLIAGPYEPMRSWAAAAKWADQLHGEPSTNVERRDQVN